MKFICLLLLIFTQSCAQSELRMAKKYDSIDMSFQPYVEEFILASKGTVTHEQIKNLTMGFANLNAKDDYIGMCNYMSNEIDISVEWWLSHPAQNVRQELIFHEMGHCVLYRGHTQETDNNGFVAWIERLGFKLGIFKNKKGFDDYCPSSIMYPYSLSERCIDAHFNYYIEELFGRENIMTYVEPR